MSDEDRAVAEEASGEAIEETARGGSPYRLRLVAHDPSAYDWYYNVDREPDAVVHPALPLGARERAGHRPRPAPRMGRGLRRRSTGTSRTRSLAELERRAGRRGLLPRLPPLPRAGPRSGARSGRAPRPFRPHPVADAGLLARAPGDDPPGDPRGPPGERRGQLPHPSLAPELPALLRRHPGRRGRLQSPRRSATEDVSPTCARVRSRSTPTSSTSWPESEAVLEQEAAIEAERPEFLILRVDRTDPSKNVVRGFRAFELYLDAHPRCTGACRCSRCSTRRVRTSPSTPSTSARSSARPGSSTTASSARAGYPLDLQIQDNFPQAVAAYKQFDVLLVNAIFDGMNLVAKEAPLVNERDGVLDPLGERGRARGAGGVGADGQPVRRRRPGRGDPRGAHDGRRRAPTAARGDPRTRARERHRRPGSQGSSRTSTRRRSRLPRRSRRSFGLLLPA